MQESAPEPWEQLRSLLQDGNAAALASALDALAPADAARALARLETGEQVQLLQTLPPERVAELVLELPQSLTLILLEELDTPHAAAIVDLLPSDEQADIIAEVDEEKGAEIVGLMSRESAADVAALREYPPDTAGGRMVREYLAFPETARVSDVIDELRRNASHYAGYESQYVYAISAAGELLGVLRLRDLVLAPADLPLSALMIPDPVQVAPETSLDDLVHTFDRAKYFGLPVTSPRGKLLGVVLRSDVEEAVQERAERRFRFAAGLFGSEELRSMPWQARVGRRLPWLAISICLNLLAASVVGLFQDTLSAVISLAVFLPVISGMSGNSGTQAMAVSIRELSLGILRPDELSWVLAKELAIGGLNGLAMGTLLGAIAWLWQRNVYLSLVVSLSMIVSMLLAVCLGGAIPLILSRRKIDPALASGPILTTLSDVCGFAFTLALATFLRHQLGH